MPGMQDLNAMYLFAKVVEHGSYSAAARALGLQTSKLSRRISDLERQLGSATAAADDAPGHRH